MHHPADTGTDGAGVGWAVRPDGVGDAAGHGAAERASAVKDAPADPLVLLDARGRIVNMNAAWLRQTEGRGTHDPSAAVQTGMGTDYLALCRAAAAGGDETAAWWIASRRPRRQLRPDGTVDAAGDIWLSVIDDEGGPQSLADVTLLLEGICGNRNLPARLPFAVGRPRLQLRDGNGPVGRICCLDRPTRTLRPTPGRGAVWRLVSHLALNHLSLVDSGDGRAGESFREILRLYLLDDLDNYEQRARWIDGIAGVSGRRVAARVPGPHGGVCRGMEVRIEIDEDKFADGAGYLFASVLERFLGSWVSLNSFTRLVAASRQLESRKEAWRWPPRAGNRVLV